MVPLAGVIRSAAWQHRLEKPEWCIAWRLLRWVSSRQERRLAGSPLGETETAQRCGEQKPPERAAPRQASGSRTRRAHSGCRPASPSWQGTATPARTSNPRPESRPQGTRNERFHQRNPPGKPLPATKPGEPPTRNRAPSGRSATVAPSRKITRPDSRSCAAKARKTPQVRNNRVDVRHQDLSARERRSTLPCEADHDRALAVPEPARRLRRGWRAFALGGL